MKQIPPKIVYREDVILWAHTSTLTSSSSHTSFWNPSKCTFEPKLIFYLRDIKNEREKPIEIINLRKKRN